MLEEHFDISEFIPSVFYNAFQQRLGRKRDYPLTGFLSALILQKIFSIPSDSLLLFLLNICREMRDFCGFFKALISYNPRNESTLKKVGYNEYDYPTCPNTSSLAMKYCGVAREKGRIDRIKWGCPKVHMVKGQWVCDCGSLCSTTKKGRTTYTYENMELQMFPGIQRDTNEWDRLYKIRTIVKRAINHFKINMCVADIHTYKEPSDHKSRRVPGRNCQPA